MAHVIAQQSVLSTPSPMETQCAEVRTYFKSNACCGADNKISTPAPFCPTLDELITYPMKMGNWTPCPAEEYYSSYSAGNTAAPGYTGCVSEDDAKPCGWYDYYSYDASTNACTQTATLKTAIQTVRGGSPTMTADMIRLTGDTMLPTVSFPAIPMAYPTVRSNPAAHEMAELSYTWGKFMTYYGSELDLSKFKGYADYGAEQGMVTAIATKILELVSTTCNRDFYAFLEAPAYGYDWSQAVAWVDTRTSSFFEDSSCPCMTAGPADSTGKPTSTCKNKGLVTISQVGWAPVKKPALPTKKGADGVEYKPSSTSANSPWIQTNVIPGNPIGRFNDCVTPQDRCLCDGVYWYKAFVPAGYRMRNIKCYSWAFSLTKTYSAQLRAGIMYVMDYTAAQSAASQIFGKALSIANGLMSYMQVHGQISLMNKMMEKPYSDPTSWLHAFARAQYEKWDQMAAGFAACEAASVVKITAEQPKYFGAYIFSHMMTPLMGLSANIGAASSDFFKSVIGYDHFNYYWGWRGEDPKAYGVGTTITMYDFHRTHTFRAFQVYEEEARRMKLVCGNKDAKVTSSLLSVNEWVTLRKTDAGRRQRRQLKDAKDETFSLHERALLIQEAAPGMALVDAIKHAEMTNPHRKLEEGEHGLPSNMEELDYKP